MARPARPYANRAPFPAFAGIWGAWGTSPTVDVTAGPRSLTSATTSDPAVRQLPARIAAAYAAGNTALGDKLTKQLRQAQNAGLLVAGSSPAPSPQFQVSGTAPLPAATGTSDAPSVPGTGDADVLTAGASPSAPASATSPWVWVGLAAAAAAVAYALSK